MRYSTRTFLLSFLPFALLLAGSFWTIQKMVENAVRDSLRSTMRQTQASIGKVRSRSELQNSRFLRMLSENATLKAGLRLLLAERGSRDVRLTVEDQLREMSLTLAFDFLLVSGSDGAPLAGVMRVGEQLAGIDVERFHAPAGGLLTAGDRTYQVVSTPINQGDENLGMLSVGEPFDFSEFTSPAVLLRNGKVLKSSIPGMSPQAVEASLAGCTKNTECELRLNGETYLSLPLQSLFFDGGYQLRTLQSVDAAGNAMHEILSWVFLITGLGAMLGALALSVVSSRSIVQPLAAVVSRLRDAERTGVLPEFPASESAGTRSRLPSIEEIRELMVAFNRAAQAHREEREKLHFAYVEFVGSLASALDARDHYTAGHSRRVSEYACALGEALQLSGDALAELRIGALLHDIGKIGIADSVLQKPGRLTREEFALIQQHPSIGRRILEGVQGFHPFLPVVELHHENWDGTGYPRGLSATSVPLDARIVHVADAYDAMTSDRPYRAGMSHEDAIGVLEEFAGSQFDPHLVAAFVQLEALTAIRRPPARESELAHDPAGKMRTLAAALGTSVAPETIVQDRQEKV